MFPGKTVLINRSRCVSISDIQLTSLPFLSHYPYELPSAYVTLKKKTHREDHADSYVSPQVKNAHRIFCLAVCLRAFHVLKSFQQLRLR